MFIAPLLVAASLAPGGWGTGGCASGQCAAPYYPQATVVAQDRFKWVVSRTGDEDLLYITHNGLAIGAIKDGRFWPLDTAGWGPPSPELKPEAKVVEQSVPLTGVDVKELEADKARGRTTVCGKQVSDEAGKLALGKDKLTDDSSKKILTVIAADEADRKKVEADWNSHPALAQIKDKYHFQSYPADAPMVTEVGAVTTGKPTIYFQKPDGTNIFRLDAYPGPEKLAEYIRQKDPTYDPAKDVDPSKATVPAAVANVPLWAWVVGGSVGTYLLFRRKQTV